MSVDNPFAPPRAPLAPAVTGGGALRYAGFWRRFAAFWIDALALVPLTGLTLLVNSHSRQWSIGFQAPLLVVLVWFNVYLVKRYGGTPGKLAMKLRITRPDGTAVGYREAVLRYAVQFVLTAVTSLGLMMATLQMSDEDYLGVGFMQRAVQLTQLAPRWYWWVVIIGNAWVWSEFVVMMTNRKRRALQDFMAGTVVVHKSPRPIRA